MEIVLTEDFVNDLSCIKNYLLDKTESGYDSIRFKIFKNISYLKLFPEFGKKTKDKNYRIVIVKKYDYKIFYKINKDKIYIMRLIHGKRNFVL
jgi:plasmid stabilization system protein ParE